MKWPTNRLVLSTTLGLVTFTKYHSPNCALYTRVPPYTRHQQQHRHGPSRDSFSGGAPVAKLWECPCHSVKYSSTTRALNTKLPRPWAPSVCTLKYFCTVKLHAIEKHTDQLVVCGSHTLEGFCSNVMQLKHFCTVKPFLGCCVCGNVWTLI